MNHALSLEAAPPQSTHGVDATLSTPRDGGLNTTHAVVLYEATRHDSGPASHEKAETSQSAW